VTKDLISIRARTLLADELTEWNLLDLEAWFRNAGIVRANAELGSEAWEDAINDRVREASRFDPLSDYHELHREGRREFIRELYSTLDFSKLADVRKFLSASAAIVTEVERQHEDGLAFKDTVQEDDAAHPLTRFVAEMKRCGFNWVGDAFVPVSDSARLADIKAFAQAMDLPQLRQHVARIESSLEADPSQAIGSAKELVETAARVILEKHRICIQKDLTITQLGGLVFKTLKELHVPRSLEDSSGGKQAVKILLSSLGNIVEKVGQLRNSYGTGHGKTGDAQSPEARHARLAAGAAAVLVSYWLETDSAAAPESDQAEHNGTGLV
jgi:hypothetical protein